MYQNVARKSRRASLRNLKPHKSGKLSPDWLYHWSWELSHDCSSGTWDKTQNRWGETALYPRGGKSDIWKKKIVNVVVLKIINHIKQHKNGPICQLCTFTELEKAIRQRWPCPKRKRKTFHYNIKWSSKVLYTHLTNLWPSTSMHQNGKLGTHSQHPVSAFWCLRWIKCTQPNESHYIEHELQFLFVLALQSWFSPVAKAFYNSSSLFLSRECVAPNISI